MSASQEIPLFPLRIVLFPGGRVDLQIFEQRYIDLIRSSLRHDTGFGICLLKQGEEVIRPGTQQTIHRTGTYSVIVDWDQLDNGLLGITVEGQTKFTIDQCYEEASGLLRARVIFSERDGVGKEEIPISDDFTVLVELLNNLKNHPMVERKQLTVNENNLWDLGWRLSELIPVENGIRQQLLEIDNPRERIERIEELVSDLANGN